MHSSGNLGNDSRPPLRSFGADQGVILPQLPHSFSIRSIESEAEGENSCDAARCKSGFAHFTLSYVLRYASLSQEATRECELALRLDPGTVSLLRQCIYLDGSV
jgi:hypothetical protein